MAVLSEEYQSLVLDDLKTYVGLTHPLKSNIITRLVVRKMSLGKLHPNPDDEFSMPEIGPSYEIVSNYSNQFRFAINTGGDPIKEPLIIEKMSTGGYMLLNGHHRWLAAHHEGMKTVPVQIVNVTPEEEIYNAISKSARNMCVSFDFDEVLLTDAKSDDADKRLKFPLNKIYPGTLRKNAAALIRDLQTLGFDVWIYTGNYHSTEYINGLFSIHNVKVDGIVNGLSKRKSNRNIKKYFTDKYNISLHIDNESVICVDTKSKNYDTYDITPDKISWAADVMTKIKNSEMLSERIKDLHHEKN